MDAALAEAEAEEPALGATSGTCGDNLTWTLDDEGTLTISGTGAMTNWSSYSIVPWYSNRSSIRSVSIDEGVTTISHLAFYGCSILKTIAIPDSVTTIGQYSISYCASLTHIYIGSGLRSWSTNTFENCPSLVQFTVSDEHTALVAQEGVLLYPAGHLLIAFPAARAGNYTIPDGIQTIQQDAFYGARNIRRLGVPVSVTTIGKNAFANVSGLTDVYYGGTEAQWNAISIGSNNEPLTSATIHFAEATPTIVASGTCGANLAWELDADGTLTIFGTGAMTNWSYTFEAPWYSNRSSIKTVVIESGVTSIGDYAFYNCKSLTSATIGNGVTRIGKWAFSHSSLTSVTIPDSVTSIGENAFYSCTGLASVTIPDSVTSIAAGAFSGCTALASVTIPDSVTNIWSNTFNNCSSLTSVIIGNGVASIGDKAFLDCTALTSVTIGNGVTSIGTWAFGYCTALTSVTIPDSVTCIGDRAFYSCSSLTSVTIGDSVTSIGSSAFGNCSSLTSVTIPDSVTSIGNYAFGSCSSLTSIDVSANSTDYASVDGVLFNKDRTTLIAYPGGKTGSYTIPNSVTSIGNDAFYYCSSLTSVTIPNSVTSIGNDAFYDCSSLSDVYYGGTRAQWNAISIYSYNQPLLNATKHFEWKQQVGDVNGDGEVGGKDLTTLRRYLVGDSVAIISINADANRDGTVSGKDVTILRRYLAGGYGVTLE